MSGPSLVERLRDGVLYGDARLHNPKGHDPLRMEAADQIEADGQRIAELEAALRDVIVECEDGCWSNAITIARAALGVDTV